MCFFLASLCVLIFAVIGCNTTSPRIANGMDSIFHFHAHRSWETICNIFLVPWEPTFISFNEQKHVFKHTFKLKNISVYY